MLVIGGAIILTFVVLLVFGALMGNNPRLTSRGRVAPDVPYGPSLKGENMSYLRSLGFAGVIAFGSSLAIAQTTASPGVHAVALPKSSRGAKKTQSTTLLETAHLKLVSIVVPKGENLAAHAASGQVSIQALSGAGELRMGARTERLDATHAVVLAPGTTHEVHADAQADLTLLVHEVLLAPKMMDRGMGAHHMGKGPGPGPGGSMPSGATPPSGTSETKK